MKICVFRLRFHWNVSLRVQLTISQHWFRKWLGAGQAKIHYLNHWWLDYWRINTSFDLNELTDGSLYYDGIYTITPDSLKCRIFEDVRTIRYSICVECMHMGHSRIVRVEVNKYHWWIRCDDAKMKFYSWFRRETIFVSRLLFNYMSCRDELSHGNVKTCKRFPHCWRFLGEFIGHRQIRLKKVQSCGASMFFSLGQAVDQMFELSVIWDSMTLLWRHCDVPAIASSRQQAWTAWLPSIPLPTSGSVPPDRAGTSCRSGDGSSYYSWTSSIW